jgi:hypothetical protein
LVETNRKVGIPLEKHLVNEVGNYNSTTNSNLKLTKKISGLEYPVKDSTP